MTLLKSALFGAAMAALLASFAMRSEPAPAGRKPIVAATESVFDRAWADMPDPASLTKSDRELLPPVQKKAQWPTSPIVLSGTARVQVAEASIPEQDSKAVQPKNPQPATRKSCKRVKVFHHGKYWWRCKR